ncbi:MAG TPA: nuclear transport factor 2 family protein [Acidimicrobiales bacterium]|nr:nuclear transport factor 2 family protein [Acidimicrobiales bacterium]
MSNVEIVATIQQAIKDQNLWAVVRHLDPDIRWAVDTSDRSAAPWFADFRGRQGVLAFFEALSANELQSFEVKDVVGDGDTVMAWIHVAYRTPNGGLVDMDEVQVWELSGGKVQAVTLFPDTLQIVQALAYRAGD